VVTLLEATGGGGAGHTVGVKTPRLTSQAPGLHVSSKIAMCCMMVIRKLTRVELRVDGLDKPLLRSGLIGVLDGLESNDTCDLLGLLAGALGEPADGDLLVCDQFDLAELIGWRRRAYAVAVVPEVQNLKRNGRLSALASLERLAGVEDRRAELQGSWESASHYITFLFFHARNRGALMQAWEILGNETADVQECSAHRCRHR
jgi:hypothetical protein